MASPLKLKSERIGKVAIAEDSPNVSVLVDTGVYHLDGPFDYHLPKRLDLQVGEWVSVPFKNRNHQGLIIERGNKPFSAISNSKILPVNRAIRGPKLDKTLIEFYQSIAKRWAVPIFDVLRFVTKIDNSTEIQDRTGDSKRLYRQLSPLIDEITQVREIATKISKSGKTLVIVPERRVADQLISNDFAVGMRGSVLSPSYYKNVLILREESEHHYELRSPGFNSRDVALIRNQILGENLLFLGFTPSLEMGRLLETGYVKLIRASLPFKGRTQITAKPSLQGELIPSGLIKPFKEALRKGPALVIAPTKGYGLAISCAACRNIAKCDCGGKLSKTSKSADPKCVICGKDDQNWRCKFCQKTTIYLIARGIDRIAEEFGKSFPNTEIHIATADKNIDGPVGPSAIVIATVGAAPLMKYSTVMFLDGINLAADLRSEERYLSVLFRHVSLSKGRALIVERPENPAVNALLKWQPFSYITRQLNDLTEAELPPSRRHALLKGELDESSKIYIGLLTALREGRLPDKTKIFNVGGGIISIFFALKDSQKVLDFIYEFQKRRSISGKPMLKMRIDPYQLG